MNLPHAELLARATVAERRTPARCVVSIALASLACGACAWMRPHEASQDAIARSFEPYRALTIGTDDAETFLRRRTAMLISGPNSLVVESDDGRLTDRARFSTRDKPAAGEPPSEAAIGAAAAVSADGYFLTAAHALAAGPTHAVIEVAGKIEWARTRTVWSHDRRDVALVHADLRPEAWFELAPDRTLAAGEVVLAFSHYSGPSAGELEVLVDLPALRPYQTLEIPHDTPLRGGHSGGPAATVDGHLLGIQSSTGMDTLFLRRGFFVRVPPDELARLIDEDRRAVR